LQCTHYSQPDHKAQPFELPHATVDPQYQAVIEIFCERAHPLAAAPSAPSTLALGQDQKWSDLPLGHKAEPFSVSRINRFMDEYGPLLARGKLGNSLCLEQGKRRR